MNEYFWEDFRELQEECYNTSKSSGFHNLDSKMSVVFDLQVSQRLMLIVSEIAEAFEDHRNGELLNKWSADESGKPHGFPIELADVAIRLMDLAQTCNIDLAEAIRVKMDFNKTREVS